VKKLDLPLAAVADFLGFSDPADHQNKGHVRFSEDLPEAVEITPYGAKYGLDPRFFLYGPRFEEGEDVTVLVLKLKASEWQWLPTDGKVLRYLTSPIVSEGPQPPAGCEIPEGAVQVQYLKEEAGQPRPVSKWIMPEYIGVEIQKTAPSFSVGDRVQCWSMTSTAWLDAVVQEILAAPMTLEGVEFPAGTLRVASPNDLVKPWRKFVRPELSGIDLKLVQKNGENIPLNYAKLCTHSGQRQSRSPSSKSPLARKRFLKPQSTKPASTNSACFSVGEQVLVWSSSEKTFKQGKILRVLTSSAEPCPQTGKMQRVGSILVRHSKGAKWIPPEFLSREIRKVEPPAATPHDHEASEIQALRFGLEATVAPQRTSVSLPARAPGPVLGEPSNPLEQLRAPFGILDVGEVLSGLTSQLREDSAGLLSFASWTNLRDGWHQ